MKLVEFAVDGIARQVERGAEGSLENPYASGAWRLSRVVEFFGSREQPVEGRVLVSPDLCQYGLQDPGKEDIYWKQRVTIAATYPELSILEIQCAGMHRHQQVRGNVSRWSVAGPSCPER